MLNPALLLLAGHAAAQKTRNVMYIVIGETSALSAPQSASVFGSLVAPRPAHRALSPRASRLAPCAP